MNLQVYHVLCILCVFISETLESKSLKGRMKKICQQEHFISKTWIVEESNINLHFSLCRPLHDSKCLNGSYACLFNKLNNQFINIGTGYKNDNFVLRSVNGSTCRKNIQYSLVLEFQCSDNTQEIPKLINYGVSNCELTIHMMDPTCQPLCTTNINGHLIDLRKLTTNIPIILKDKQFNIQVCGNNKICNDDIAACQIINSTIVPLSTVESQIISYDNHQLEVHGNFKSENREAKYKLYINCNWETEVSNATYKEVSHLGKNYVFNMESRYGCVKLFPTCVFSDDWYEYNLTNLNDSNGWKVVNSTLKMNVCGPLILPTENVCSRTLSQICDITNNVNRGSIISDFVIKEDSIEVSIFSGSVCNQTSLSKYSTKITFYCSDTEQGPQFHMYNDCITYLIWKSPKACPTCKANITNKSPDSCSHMVDDKLFDLSPLNKTYAVQDLDNNVEYLLNPCVPIIDEEVKCAIYSYGLIKKLNEPNLKHRVTFQRENEKFNILHAAKALSVFEPGIIIYSRFLSIGRLPKASFKDNELSLELLDGNLCEDFTSSKAVIKFICSDLEDFPKLTRKDKCIYEFIWKTPYVCSGDKSCKIDTDKNYNYNLNFLTKKMLEVKDNGFVFQFNICENIYSKCSNGTCKSNSIARRYILNSEPNHIFLRLNTNCSESIHFNKVILNLECDEEALENQYIYKNRNNCVLTITVKTNYVCKTNQVSKIDHLEIQNASLIEQDKTIYEHVDHYKEKNKTYINKCYIASNYTGYTLNISSLKSDVPLDSNCPQITLNTTSQSVNLLYLTDVTCLLDGIMRRIKYMVYVKCSNMNQTSVKASEVCFEHSEVDSTEACKLFKPKIELTAESNVNIPAIIGGVSGVIVLPLIIIGGILWIKKKKSRANYSGIYMKDGDL